MKGSGFVAIAAVSLLAMTVGLAPAIAASDPLAAYAWKARVLLVIAPSADDPKLAQQRAAFKAMGDEARTRDLVLVVVVGKTAESSALRRRFDLDEGFHAVLIGKDGGDKLTSADPLGAEALYPIIDAMPMRRQEMRRGS